ncbi:hypothetical protein ALCH109712_02660 [Alkalicoccus chagannorensis]
MRRVPPLPAALIMTAARSRLLTDVHERFFINSAKGTEAEANKIFKK